MDNKENNSKNGITILTLVVSILAIVLSGAALVFTIFNNTGNKAEPEAPAVQLISKFHQSSVLIQSNKTTTEFYSGS